MIDHEDRVLAPGGISNVDAGVALQLELEGGGVEEVFADDEDFALFRAAEGVGVAGTLDVLGQVVGLDVPLAGVVEEFGGKKAVLDGAAEFVEGDVGDVGGFDQSIGPFLHRALLTARPINYAFAISKTQEGAFYDDENVGNRAKE